jgi:predicted nuclease of restriction endonuclease-like (RecB) superfamily
VRTQFSWTQYKLLLSIDNEEKRELYIAESLKKQLEIRPPARATGKQFIMTENK